MTHDPGGRSAGPGPRDLDWRQLADALWLAVCSAETDRGPGRPDPGPLPGTPEADVPPPGDEPADEPRQDRRRERPASGPEGAPAAVEPPLPAELVGVSAPPGEAEPATVAEAFVPVRRPTAAGPPLPERALSRALRPLKRTSPSPVETEVDEEATAERAARDGLWVPDLVPVRERWMDAVLVVDCGSSMVVWRRTAAHLVTVLHRTGAFRDVRVHRVDTDHPLSAEDRSPVEGMPPRGKRTVLVLTDGIGAAWADESAQRALAGWARHASVAVIHVLHQGRWHHTGVAPERVRVRLPEPGAPNGTWRRADGGSWPGGAPPVPVLELDARWMANWARLVARPSARGDDTMALLPGAPAEHWDPEPEPSAWDRVFRFRATASPSAFRLASRLAAAPLNIPVMEFVQGIHHPEGSPGDLAEVLLGGLLRKVGAADPLDETGIGYEFHDGVRELLLSAGMRDESLYILGSVLDRLGRRWKPLLMLRDLLNHPSGSVGDLPRTERLLPYIRLQEQVYQALSGPYLEGARSFRALVLAHQALARSGESPPDPVEDASHRGKYVVSEAVAAMTDSTTPRTDPLSQADDSPSPPAHGTPGPAGEHLRGTFVSVTAARSLPAVEERQPGEPPSIWGNVPPRNNNFTGRQTLLDTLHERLRSEGTAAVLPEALHGLG
ncbi:ATP/GTP-binding protein, partial [Streptomyces sp. PRKS01-29]